MIQYTRRYIMDFSQIPKKYSYTTELHSHSFPVSACGEFKSYEVVEFYKSAGVDSLVLTNHLNPLWISDDPDSAAKEYLSDYLLAKEAAAGDIELILGVEIRFPENNNDYLIYGVEECDVKEFIKLIPYGISNFYKQVKNDKNIIIQAHPFRKHMTLAPLDSIDGIESMNMHPDHHAKPSIAFKYAKENGLLVTGGSDFHNKGYHALCLMRTETKMKSSFDIANAIKSRDVVFDCSGHIIIPYIY